MPRTVAEVVDLAQSVVESKQAHATLVGDCEKLQGDLRKGQATGLKVQ